MSVVLAKIPFSREVASSEQSGLSKRSRLEELPELKFDKFLEEKLRLENTSQRKERLVGDKSSETNVPAQDKSKTTGLPLSEKKKEDPVAATLEARFHQNSQSCQKNTPLTQQGQAPLLEKGGGDQKQPPSVKELDQKSSSFDSLAKPEKNSFRAGSLEALFENRTKVAFPKPELSSEKGKDAASSSLGSLKGGGDNFYSARFRQEGKEHPHLSLEGPNSSGKVHYINLDGKMHRVGFAGANDQSLRPTGTLPLKNGIDEQSGLTFKAEQGFPQALEPSFLMAPTSDKAKSLPSKIASKEKGDGLVTGKVQTPSSESARLKQDMPTLRNIFQDSSGLLFEDEGGFLDDLDTSSVSSKGQDASPLRSHAFTKALLPKGLPSPMGAGTLESPKFVAVNVSPPSPQKAGSISLQLMPEVLGRLEVDVRLTRDGRLDAVVKTEKSETFETFQRDAATLKQVIAEAFGADPSDMGFTLLDDSGAQPGTHHHDLESQYAMQQENRPFSEDGTDLAVKSLTNPIDQNRALDALV